MARMWNRSNRHCSEQQIDRSGLLSFAAAQLAGSFELDITVNAIAVAFAGPDLSAIQEKVAKAQKSRGGRVRKFVFAAVADAARNCQADPGHVRGHTVDGRHRLPRPCRDPRHIGARLTAMAAAH
jgi:hypothetical protein